MGKVERVFSPGFNAAEFIMHFGYTSFGQLAGNIWSLFSVSFCHYVVFESIDMGPTVMLITKQFAGGKEIPKCVCLQPIPCVCVCVCVSLSFLPNV